MRLDLTRGSFAIRSPDIFDRQFCGSKSFSKAWKYHMDSCEILEEYCRDYRFYM
jgi:hypothetical protein